MQPQHKELVFFIRIQITIIKAMKMPRVQIKFNLVFLPFSIWWNTKTSQIKTSGTSGESYSIQLCVSIIPQLHCIFSLLSPLQSAYLFILCVCWSNLNKSWDGWLIGRLINRGQRQLSILMLSSMLNVWLTTYRLREPGQVMQPACALVFSPATCNR